MDKRAIDSVRRRVQDSGGRITAPRVRVLGVLMGARRALAHSEIEKLLGKTGAVDRVTLYRVLDWLVEKGMAHRISGADRAWRYSIADAGHGDHAHFQCSHCGKTLCLEDVQQPAVRLPRGFRQERVEMTVQGVCAECA